MLIHRGANRLRLATGKVYFLYVLLYLYIHIGACVNICGTVCICVGVLIYIQACRLSNYPAKAE